MNSSRQEAEAVALILEAQADARKQFVQWLLEQGEMLSHPAVDDGKPFPSLERGYARQLAARFAKEFKVEP